MRPGKGGACCLPRGPELPAHLGLRDGLTTGDADLAQAHFVDDEIVDTVLAPGPVVVDAEQFVSTGLVGLHDRAPRAVQVIDPPAGSEKGFDRLQQALGRHQGVAFDADLGDRESDRIDDAGRQRLRRRCLGVDRNRQSCPE